MRHMSDTRETHECSTAAVEALLRASACWQPDDPIAEGMLAETLTGRTQARLLNQTRWGMASLCVPIAAALLLMLAMPHERGMMDRTAPEPGPAEVRPLNKVPPVGDRSGPLASASEQIPMRVVTAARKPAQTHPRGRYPSASAIGRRSLSGRRPGCSAKASTDTRQAIGWKTYRVPRYVSGVSMAAWIRTDGADGESDFVPAILDVPLGETYGEPSDDPSIEVDIIPVRYVMEEFHE